MEPAVSRAPWMAACEPCGQLADAIDVKFAESGFKAVVLEYTALCAHLVEAHLAQLPGYDDTCSNCREWRKISGDPAGSLSLTAVRVLGREDLMHRAGHLLDADHSQ